MIQEGSFDWFNHHLTGVFISSIKRDYHFVLRGEYVLPIL